MSSHPDLGGVAPTLLENLAFPSGEEKPDFEDFLNKNPGFYKFDFQKPEFEPFS